MHNFLTKDDVAGDPASCLLQEYCSYWRQAHEYDEPGRVFQCPDQLRLEHAYLQGTLLRHCYRPQAAGWELVYREANHAVQEILPWPDDV